jgi:tRNA(fMet)-specific endonuclease VapC
MLDILDTDHVSLVQRGNTHVRANLEQISSVDQRAVTIITVIEQLQGRLAVIHQARSEVEVARGGER